ncbi:MAG: hypothetical protein ACOYL9_02630 [Ilumatobacteraceae bacterium]
MIGVTLAAVAILPFPLMRSPKFRLWCVVFGAILVFQSSDGVSAPKLAYLGALGLSVALALPERQHDLVRVSGGVAFVLGTLGVMAVVNGIDPLSVIRDSSNYFLLLAAAPLAFHFGRWIPVDSIRRTTLAVGFAGTYAFVAQWIVNRGLGSIPAPGVPSTALIGLALAMCCAIALEGRRAGWWWSGATAIVILGLLTGTRNMLLLVVIPLSFLVQVARRSPTARRKARRALRSALIGVPIMIAVLVPLAQAGGVDTTAAFERIASVTSSTSSKGSGQSLAERNNQQAVAVAAFLDDPFLGSGPGTLWRWPRYNGSIAYGYTMDTSVVVLAKWGLVGAVPMAVLLVAWWRFLRAGRREPTLWSSVATALVPFLLLQSVLNTIIEDRGLPLCLVLLGAGTVATRRAGHLSMPLARTDAMVGAQPASMERR